MSEMPKSNHLRVRIYSNIVVNGLESITNNVSLMAKYPLDITDQKNYK